MPSTLNGTGTMYYGKRDVDIGGAYVTTKWATIFWLPIVPLSSWRVFPLTEERISLANHRLEQTFDAAPVPLNWLQVINVYLVALACMSVLWYVVGRHFL
jgi:hypothetical protein